MSEMIESMVERVSSEELTQKVIMAISTASVPHPAIVAGGIDSRSLHYYLSVGIDTHGHDHSRHEALLRKAADQVIFTVTESNVARLSADDLIEEMLRRQHADGSITLTAEIYVGGVRHNPGNYLLSRLSLTPIGDGE